MEDNGRGMTVPGAYGDKPLARRDPPKGMLPSTWINRSVRAEVIGLDGKSVPISGTLVDWFPFGPVLRTGSTRTMYSWDSLRLIELVND